MSKRIGMPMFVYYLNNGNPAFGPDIWIKAVATRTIFSKTGSWADEQFKHSEKLLEITCENEPQVEEELIESRIINAVDCGVIQFN